MACRRRRQHSAPDKSDRHVPNNMDHLAFKYMEMCKVDTDSDSEISPRWSDTSTVGCVSIAPQSETLQTLQLKPAARHGCYSLFLDPYDGSSEDSDESNINDGVSRRTKQRGKGGGGGCRFSGRSRTFVLHHPASVARREVVKTGMRDPATEQQHLFDIQMKCGSDSEATISSTPHTPVGGSSSQVLDSSSERSPSPCNVRSIYKRKLGLHGADVVELGQRKRQCVVNMEDQDGVDSASEPC
ncbi:uncharacterized protein LOC113148198 isoform X3 [Anabas testudineus]|uniref:uncharacterized protein LOC113148198 isoform X3 n=1 Tax=Anabas testudineus TaxID=64144 RepID=UPI000E45482A|nr:uncharacterized protein LOC113148198 isoform X3 [Anabas testudineus]